MSLVYIVLGALCLIHQGACEIQTKLTYFLEEESASGILIGNVGKDSRLEMQYPDVFSSLQFTILSQSPNLESGLAMFSVSSQGGTVRTQRKIDRDAICPHQSSCNIQLNIKVEPIQYFHILQVTIHILDINDNVPSFPVKVTERSLPESSVVGSKIGLPSAIDNDSPENSIQRYSLIDNTRTFSILVTNDTTLDSEVYLILNKILDREVKESYTLGLVAYDGYGSTAQSGSATIKVKVLDVNDNSPVFDQPSYDFTVDEPLPAESWIGKVTATDKDAGENAEIIYTLSASDASLPFIVNATTGDIYSTQLLDHEVKDVYSFGVQARDKGETSLPVTTRISVKVKDINDNSPLIAIQGQIGLNHVVELSENSPIDTFIAHITVTDADSDANGDFDCSLNVRDFGLEQLVESEFKVITKVRLDRETTNRYDLVIKCEDRGTPKRQSQKSLYVTVLDENDNPPHFTESVYLASILENSKQGEAVLNVTAVDPDVGDNGRVLYSIEDKAKKNFSINSYTGLVQSKVSFDREVMGRVQFKVFAVDQGQKLQYTATSTVIVDIMDANDERPTFEETKYSFAVYENQPPGTEVGQVKAYDLDLEPFNSFVYTLQDPNNSSALVPFEMDPYTGKIWTTTALDRESVSEYRLVAYATSVGLHPTAGTTYVHIYVADKNDNSPVLSFPQEFNNTIYVSNQLPKNTVVAMVNATDNDNGQNSVMSFYFKDPANDLFVIEESTGVILTHGNLDNYPHHTFSMTIVVRDHGIPPRTTEGSLSIIVNKSIPYTSSPSNLVTKHNLTIVVIIACVSAVVMVLLAVAIAAIWFVHRRAARKHRHAMLSKQLIVLSQPSPTDQDQLTPEVMVNNHKDQDFKDNLTKGHSYQNGSLKPEIFPRLGNHTTSNGYRRPPPKPPRVPQEQEVVAHKPPVAPPHRQSGRLLSKELKFQGDKLSAELPPEMQDCCSSGGSEGSDAADSGRGSSDDATLHNRPSGGHSPHHPPIVRRVPSDIPPIRPPKRGSLRSYDLSPGYHGNLSDVPNYSVNNYSSRNLPDSQIIHNNLSSRTPGRNDSLSFHEGYSNCSNQAEHGSYV